MATATTQQRRLRVLLGATGSVAAIKVPQLAAALLEHGADVRVVATASALRFINNATTTLPPAVGRVLTDADEWEPQWRKVGDPVLHIDLREWADVLLIAPLSADTLAKIATGLCDNLLTSIARAWDFGHKQLVLAPAMNTLMWTHPLTAKQLAEIRSWGPHSVAIVPPVAKKLACGDVGEGALAPINAIVSAVFTPAPRL